MKKFVAITIFILIACFICYIAPYYYIEETYEEGEVRVIFNEREITKKIPQKAILIDGKIMLSQDTVDIYFDKWLYYDEKYDTIITTTETQVAKLKLGEKNIQIGDENVDIEVPAQRIDGEIYIPIEDLKDVYNITVEYDDKVVITTEDADKITTTLGKKLKVHAYKKNFSKIVTTCNPGDIIDVFEYKDNPSWVLVRTGVGDLGYAKMNDIVAENVAGSLPKIEIPTPKVNLIWEYAENFTPNRTSQKKIDQIDVVSPTWIYLKNTGGDLKTTISEDYIEWAHNNGYKIWATFKNDGIGIANTSTVVTDMKTRERIISRLIEICKSYNIDGINVDFENMKKEDAGEFSQFIRELSATLRKNNLVASVDVTVPDGSDTWSLCYNRYELADAVDYLVLMAYDQYSASSKVPGSTAELNWVETNLNKMIDRDKINSNKIILGIPLYSRLWKIANERVSSTAISMQEAKKQLERGADFLEEEGQYYVEYKSGNTTYMLWVEDERSANEKLSLIEKYDLAGAAYWRWGFETEDFWEQINEN